MCAQRRICFLLLVFLAGLCLGQSNADGASDAGDMGGWEKGSDYNKLYDVRDMEQFKAEVVEQREIVPLQGMKPGIALIMRDSDGETFSAHIGPKWFVGKLPLHKGDKIRIRGVWAEIRGEDVFMVAKLKKGDDYEYKVRLTKDGTPFWTMSPGELAREKAGD